MAKVVKDVETRSKAAIIKEYMAKHPDKPNKDVFAALSANYPQISKGDIGNARALLKKGKIGQRARAHKKKSDHGVGNAKSSTTIRNGKARKEKDQRVGNGIMPFPGGVVILSSADLLPATQAVLDLLGNK